ncbi:MAG: hypothetical protein AB7G34_16630 [Hyphomicrobiales bacterium]
MRLIEELRKRLEIEQSPARAQLVREDIARLSKLETMAIEHEDMAEFVGAGLYIGWTRDDMRTHEVKEELTLLMEAIHARRHGQADAIMEGRIIDAWIAFNQARMKKLVHCL